MGLPLFLKSHWPDSGTTGRTGRASSRGEGDTVRNGPQALGGEPAPRPLMCAWYPVSWDASCAEIVTLEAHVFSALGR